MAVITISRQFGAGGKTLGRMLAAELGYQLVDEEIIQRVAEMARVPVKWVQAVENEAGGNLLKFISGLSPSRKSLVERCLEEQCGYLDEKIYVEMIRKVILQMADEGNAVLLGRGGQYILKDRRNVLHVLLVAQKPDRIAFMAKHYKLSPRHAEEVVDKMTRRRVNLYRKFGKTDYDEPSHYHFVLNMSRLNLEKAGRLLLSSVRYLTP